MISLPFDIFAEILPLVPYSALPAFAQASTEFRDYARERLYEEIPPHLTSRAFASIARNPDLARYVKRVEMTRRPGVADLDVDFHLLGTVLGHTTNLHTLLINVGGRRYSSFLADSSRVFRLRRFSCFLYIDQALIQFLHDQAPTLEDITLSHSLLQCGRGAIASGFPRLRRLNSPMSWADSILPHGGASLTQLSISHCARGASMACLGMPNIRIEWLQVPFHCFEDTDPGELGRMFPVLRQLRLSMQHSRFGWPWPGNVDIDVPHLADQLHRILGGLPALTHLTLLMMGMVWPEGADNIGFAAIATHNAPKLKDVVLDSALAASDGTASAIHMKYKDSRWTI